jgi:cell division protease FtsH
VRDEEQQHLADQAMRTALRLVREHRDKVDALAFELLRNEVVERADIERLMCGGAKPAGAPRPATGLRVVAATDETSNIG